MTDRGGIAGAAAISRRAVETIRRAFAEFLTIPTVVIAGFLALALASYLLDELRVARLGTGRGLFGGKLFSDPDTARSLLGTIATSIITVSSITFSLLLIAVQQGAASLTNVVFDQFLRRRTNQIYFGSFLGLALYCLIILATITPQHNPVYGVALACLMTVVALYVLVILIYTTIDQMRPVVIMAAIRDHTLLARERQRSLLCKTRRAPLLGEGSLTSVRAESSGFLVRVDVPLLARAAADFGGTAEFSIVGSVGAFVAFRDVIAEIRSVGGGDTVELQRAAVRALPLESQRDLDYDPAFGVEQLAVIGWTSGSTAKSNPDPALLACRSLRNILARWVDPAKAPDDDAGSPDPAPVVYHDNVLDSLFKAFESLMVVASESMQHQVLSELYRGFGLMLPRLPREMAADAEDLLLRSLSALGDHVPTAELDAALGMLMRVLSDSARPDAAEAVRAARARLASNVGTLNSRATRAAG